MLQVIGGVLVLGFMLWAIEMYPGACFYAIVIVALTVAYRQWRRDHV